MGGGGDATGGVWTGEEERGAGGGVGVGGEAVKETWSAKHYFKQTIQPTHMNMHKHKAHTKNASNSSGEIICDRNL